MGGGTRGKVRLCPSDVGGGRTASAADDAATKIK